MLDLDTSTPNPALGLDVTVTNSMLDLDTYLPNPYVEFGHDRGQL